MNQNETSTHENEQQESRKITEQEQIRLNKVEELKKDKKWFKKPKVYLS